MRQYSVVTRHDVALRWPPTLQVPFHQFLTLLLSTMAAIPEHVLVGDALASCSALNGRYLFWRAGSSELDAPGK